MRFYRPFIILLLVLFSISTVHAASMGIAVQTSAAQETTMHCHDMGDPHDGEHAKPHHGSSCVSCLACAPVLLNEATSTPVVFDVTSVQNPHNEASYASVVGELTLRPPISA